MPSKRKSQNSNSSNNDRSDQANKKIKSKYEDSSPNSQASVFSFIFINKNRKITHQQNIEKKFQKE